MTIVRTRLLALLVIVGFLIRFYQVGSLPQILNRDEAALAYNGYLLSQTGKDEFSRVFPLTLESFGDYKLPGYPYTLALLFQILPQSDWVVRLPSVVAGTILIILSYHLAKNFHFKDKMALFFAFLITVNPLFIFYSRIAFEANVALTFFVGALVLLTKKKPTWQTEGGAFLLTFIAILFYNTPLLLLPFVVVALIISRGIKNIRKWFPISVLLTGLFMSMFFMLSSISAQKSGITIFSDETIWQESVLHYNSYEGIWQKILGNRYVFYIEKIIPRYLESYSRTFLVSNGGTHPWHNLPQHAHLYYSTYFLALVGCVVLLLSARTTIKDRFILVLLLTSLAPSVITVDAPHATRSLLFIYLLTFVALYSLTIIKKKYLQRGLLVLTLLTILETSRYLYLYFSQYPNHQPPTLGVGFDQTIKIVESTYPQEKIAIVDQSGYQYILTAWYLQIPPDIFFDTIVKQLPDRIGFKYGEQLTHYHFIAQPTDRDDSEKVLVEWIDNQWNVRQF